MVVSVTGRNAESLDSTNTTIQAFPTNLGWMAAQWNDSVLLRLTFGHDSAQNAVASLGRTEADNRSQTHVQRELIDRLKAFSRGHAQDFSDVTIDEYGFTRFQRRVISECRAIQWGQRITYAELAKRAGSRGAARAVGNVMASNRFPLIVPCHRVVGAGGSLGGFSAPTGLEMKRRLLDREVGCPVDYYRCATLSNP